MLSAITGTLSVSINCDASSDTLGVGVLRICEKSMAVSNTRKIAKQWFRWDVDLRMETGTCCVDCRILHAEINNTLYTVHTECHNNRAYHQISTW
jgi:hypothetical protein